MPVPSDLLFSFHPEVTPNERIGIQSFWDFNGSNFKNGIRISMRESHLKQFELEYALNNRVIITYTWSCGACGQRKRLNHRYEYHLLHTGNGEESASPRCYDCLVSKKSDTLTSLGDFLVTAFELRGKLKNSTSQYPDCLAFHPKGDEILKKKAIGSKVCGMKGRCLQLIDDLRKPEWCERIRCEVSDDVNQGLYALVIELALRRKGLRHDFPDLDISSAFSTIIGITSRYENGPSIFFDAFNEAIVSCHLEDRLRVNGLSRESVWQCFKKLARYMDWKIGENAYLTSQLLADWTQSTESNLEKLLNGQMIELLEQQISERGWH